MAEKQFNKGEQIFHQGDAADCFYRVTEGTVGIFASYGDDRDYKLTEVKPGQFFGEMAVIDSSPRSASAVALEDNTIVEQVATDELKAFFENDPKNTTELMKALSARLRDLTRDYEEAKDIITRLGADGAEKTDDSTREKFRKFLYRRQKNPGKSSAPSAETIREYSMQSHSDGFSKSVSSYPKGTVICREGDQMECMYDIHWGRVGIYSNFGTPQQVELTILSANNFFGEMGMVTGEPRSATAVALDDNTTIELIYPEDFYELFEKNPIKFDMILRHLSSRLRTLTKQYLEACDKIAELTGGSV